MCDILREFFEGRIYPAEQIEMGSKEFRKLRIEHGTAKERFRETLSEAQLEKLEQLETTKVYIDSENDLFIFKKGFQLGMQLTLAGFEIPCTNELPEV